MKIYAPKYYKKFKCIADKCTHSCCIGWEIDIDDEALNKYQLLNGGYGEDIKNSIDYDETPHFRLCSGERCPHLNQKGLCEIILNLGEGYLCEICREHPRFYNQTVRGLELGIGMACQESARIILSSSDYGDFYQIGEEDIEQYDFDFNSVAHRERIYQIISDKAMPYNCKIEEVYTYYGISPNSYSDDVWHKIISDLEYLDQSHKELFLCYTSQNSPWEEESRYLERALAYFIYRHCSGTAEGSEFFMSLGLCLFLERLLASLIRTTGAKKPKDIAALAQIISEEIEYSTDNTEAIRKMWQGKVFIRSIDKPIKGDI